MKEIIIIAGPNGAGKTSFANQYFPFERERLTFINADEISRKLQALGQDAKTLNFSAGRLMLARIDYLVNSNKEFMFETTLASLAYAQKIPIWRSLGYTIELVYLRLPSAEDSIQRVRRRVASGGHDIPEITIRSRFTKSHKYLEEKYKPLVDEWYIWDSLEGRFELREAWDD